MTVKDMTAAIIIQKNKMLLVHNIKHNTERIEPPGGKKEHGEELETCIKREVFEELGVHVNVKELFGKYMTESPEGNFNVYMFYCEILNNELPEVKEPGKISKYGWYDYSEILRFREDGRLVPNLCKALKEIRKYF